MTLEANHSTDITFSRPIGQLTGKVALTVERVSGPAWDDAVAEFDGVCQEQLYVFAKNRWPSVEHEAQIFRWNGEVVGGVLVMIQPLPLRVGAIAVSKWGPLLKDESHPDGGAIYEAMIELLMEEYCRRRKLMLSVLPRASLTEINTEVETLWRHGFRRGSELRFPNRYIVNLRLSDEEQRKSFHQKWRYHLNKSDKEGLAFEHAPASRLPEFDALYQAMTDRKKFEDHSAYDTVSSLMEIEDERLRPELFFVRHGEEIVSGAIIFKSGDRAVYLYGATNDRALPLRAGYFLHWHVIRWLRDNTRANWYDLGGTDGFQGLHQFKKGMVGDKGVIFRVPPVANYAASPIPFMLGLGAFAARDSLNQVRFIINNLRADRAKPNQARTEEKDS